VKEGFDWLAFGYDFLYEDWMEGIPGLKKSGGGPFHETGMITDGLKYVTTPKKGCKNLRSQIEITGKFFALRDGFPQQVFKEIFQTGISYNREVRPFRIDYRWDIMDEVGVSNDPSMFEEDWKLRACLNGRARKGVKYYDDWDGGWLGKKTGKSDVVVRIYNKLEEQQGKALDLEMVASWWRVEVQIRGEVLHGYWEKVQEVDKEFRFEETLREICYTELAKIYSVPKWFQDRCEQGFWFRKQLEKKGSEEEKIVWRERRISKLQEEIQKIKGNIPTA